MIFFNVNKNIDELSEIKFFDNVQAIQKNADFSGLKILNFNYQDLGKYSEISNLAVEVSEIKNFLFLAKTNTNYAICDKKNAQKFQKLAEEYLLDIKILVKIETEDEIEEVAKNFIDGVIKISKNLKPN